MEGIFGNKTVGSGPVEEIYSDFIDTFNLVKSNSSKTIKIKKRNNSKPWITTNLSKLINERDKLFRIWKQSNSNKLNIRNQYNKARNSVNWEIQKAKENYHREKLFNSRFDI